MVKENKILLANPAEIEGNKQNFEHDSAKKLKRKLNIRNRKLKNLKTKTSKIITELDWAYKEFRRKQEELIMKERLSTASGLALGVAHEIKNSINFIGISVQHLHDKFPSGDEKRQFTEAIMDKIKRLNNVALDLIQFAQPHKPNFQKIDLHTIIDRVLSLVKFKCDIQKIEVAKKYEKNLIEMMVDKELIEQAFLNLIDNALWAMPRGGKLIISSRLLKQKNLMIVEITDTGFGLSIAYRIIEEHKGSISVRSQLKKGTTFKITLPVSQSINK
jgi:signal transduction histidine kinase